MRGLVPLLAALHTQLYASAPRHSTLPGARFSSQCALRDRKMQPAPAMKLICGSSSAGRQMILREMGVQYQIVKPDLDERALGDRSGDPEALVLLLAKAKAENIMQKQLPEGYDIVMTSDQVVTAHGRILEKPSSEEEARSFIRSFGGSSCSTVGSIALTHVPTRAQVSGTSVATLHYDPIPEQVIDQLIAQGDVMYCAGALTAEAPVLQPYMTRLDGTMDSVMGLSNELLQRLWGEIHEAIASTSNNT